MIGVQHLHRLLLKGCRVARDLLVAQHRAGRGATAGITYPGRPVADDQDDRVTGILEFAQLLQDDRVAEGYVGRGWVHAQLHPQRAPQLELGLQAALRQALDRVA